MDQIQECINQTWKHTAEFQQYSGRHVYRLGRYEECIMSQGMDYFFVQLNYLGLRSRLTYLGICLPQVCNNNTVKAILNYGLSEINFPMHAVSVTNRIYKYEHPLNWAFFAALFIIVATILLVLYSSFSSKLKPGSIIKQFAIQETNKIFAYKQGLQLNVINGVRSLAMFWIIYGHLMSFLTIPLSNYLTIDDSVFAAWRFLPIKAAFYSVDIFFFIGGFLLAYVLLKNKVKSLLKYPLALLNRYFRIVPVYFVTIMIFYGLSKQVRNDAFFGYNNTAVNRCNKFYESLLFIDNLIDYSEICMSWTWYLQNDMQLFVYCILLLAIYGKTRIGGLIAILASIAAGFRYILNKTQQIHQIWKLDHQYGFNTAQYNKNIYYMPWGRCNPYLYGLLLGVLYHEFQTYESTIMNRNNENVKQKTQIINESADNLQSKQQTVPKPAEQSYELEKSRPILYIMKIFFLYHPWCRRLFQLVGLFLFLFIVFIPRTLQNIEQKDTWSQFTHSLLFACGPLVLVISISLIVLPSIILPMNQKQFKHNKDSNLLVRFILDTKTFNFLAKISFCVYMLHSMFMNWYLVSMKHDFYYNFGAAFVLSSSLSVVSIVGAIVMVYLVEAPCAKIQKRIMDKLMSKRKKLQDKDNQNQKSEHNKDNQTKNYHQTQNKDKID